MKRLIPKRLSLAALALAISCPAMAFAANDANPETQINAANAFVRQGKYDEALDSYRRVTPTDAIKDELDYNLAVAQYLKGDIAAARSLFAEASTAPDAKLASAARYNLGNCSYADAVATAEKDKPAAIESLKQAIEDYRGSLAGNPDNVDARANIELANEMLKKLQQEEQDQQQQDQQQNEQDQDQQNQDPQSKDGDSQEDQQQQDQTQENQDQQNQQDQGSESKDNQSQDQESEQEQSKSGQQQSGSEDEQSQQEQSPDKDSQQESNKPTEKDGQPNSDPSAQENVNQSPSQDQQSQSQAQQSQADESAEEQQAEADDQPVPSGELKAASEQDASEKPKNRVAMADPNTKDGLMSKEEALKMLQAVRDRDMLRRLRQEQIERNMHVPTDRDW